MNNVMCSLLLDLIFDISFNIILSSNRQSLFFIYNSNNYGFLGVLNFFYILCERNRELNKQEPQV